MADESSQAHKGHHKSKSGGKASKRKEFLSRKATREDKEASRGNSKNPKVGSPFHRRFTPRARPPPCPRRSGLQNGAAHTAPSSGTWTEGTVRTMWK